MPGGGALVSSGASVPCRAIPPTPRSFHGHSLGTAQLHWTPEVQKITGICWRHSVWGGEAARRRPTNSRLPIAVCPMEMEHRVQTSHSTFPRSRVWKIIPGYTARGGARWPLLFLWITGTHIIDYGSTEDQGQLKTGDWRESVQAAVTNLSKGGYTS